VDELLVGRDRRTEGVAQACIRRAQAAWDDRPGAVGLELLQVVEQILARRAARAVRIAGLDVLVVDLDLALVEHVDGRVVRGDLLARRVGLGQREGVVGGDQARPGADERVVGRVALLGRRERDIAEGAGGDQRHPSDHGGRKPRGLRAPYLDRRDCRLFTRGRLESGQGDDSFHLGVGCHWGSSSWNPKLTATAPTVSWIGSHPQSQPGVETGLKTELWFGRVGGMKLVRRFIEDPRAGDAVVVVLATWFVLGGYGVVVPADPVPVRRVRGRAP